MPIDRTYKGWEILRLHVEEYGPEEAGDGGREGFTALEALEIRGPNGERGIISVTAEDTEEDPAVSFRYIPAPGD